MMSSHTSHPVQEHGICMSISWVTSMHRRFYARLHDQVEGARSARSKLHMHAGMLWNADAVSVVASSSKTILCALLWWDFFVKPILCLARCQQSSIIKAQGHSMQHSVPKVRVYVQVDRAVQQQAAAASQEGGGPPPEAVCE